VRVVPAVARLYLETWTRSGRARFPIPKATIAGQLECWYDKLEAERVVREARHSEFVIVRLPKVYGPGGKSELNTIYGFAS